MIRSLLGAGLAATAMLHGVSAQAMPIDKTLTINVYRICDDAGNNCAADGSASSVGGQYFSASTNAIWAQAGISVNYAFKGFVNNSNFMDIDDAVASKSFRTLSETVTGYYASTSVVDMFLVHTVAGAYGEGWWGRGGLVMAMDTIMGYSSVGRIDTMAHELGHNFGLASPSDPEYSSGGHSNNPSELMASGGIRLVPQTLGNIAPNGTNYDQLSAYQIAMARDSSLLQPVPEPETWALMAGGLGLLGFMRRRAQRH
jgi:hypothetical protein